jgi:hypothetical protein
MAGSIPVSVELAGVIWVVYAAPLLLAWSMLACCVVH